MYEQYVGINVVNDIRYMVIVFVGFSGIETRDIRSSSIFFSLLSVCTNTHEINGGEEKSKKWNLE